MVGQIMGNVKVVAELGVNWSTVDEALMMIEEAKKAGCDYVKFQLFNEKTIEDSPLKDRLKPLILTEEGVKYFKTKADALSIGFILTPMYLEAVDIAAKYADLIKIRFKDRENIELINKAMETDKTLLISVPYRPIKMMYNIRCRFLYCLPKYPPEPEDFNISIAETCDGVSLHYPHTLFDLAYAINRIPQECYIEKHVMLDIQHNWTERCPKCNSIMLYQGSASDDVLRDFFNCPGCNRRWAGHQGSEWIDAGDSELSAAEIQKAIQRGMAPIDANVSITFGKLGEFISQLRIIDKMQKYRID